MTVRIENAPYGTRSASVVELGPGPRDAALWWAEGAPDRTPFQDHSGALQHWLRSGQIEAEGG